MEVGIDSQSRCLGLGGRQIFVGAAVVIMSVFFLWSHWKGGPGETFRASLLLWLTACILMVLWAGGFFGRAGLQGEFLGMTTIQAKATFVLYVVLFIAVTFSTKAITAIGIDPAVLVLACNMAKTLASLVLWRAQDGTFGDLLSALARDFALVYRYSGLAWIYVICDVLRVDFIQRTSPSSFHILMNFRAVLLVVVWERIMKRHLQLPQWISIIAIATGCIFKEWHNLADMHMDGNITTYVELFTLFFMSSGAIVYNEYLLKGYKFSSVNFQNLSLYLWGCFALVGLAVLGTSLGIQTNIIANAHVLEPQQWWLLLTKPMALLQVTLLTVLGLVTSHFLRLLSAYTKEIATGVEVICSLPLDCLIYGVAFGFHEISGSLLVVLGICIVARWPLPEAQSVDEADEKTKLCQADEKTKLRQALGGEKETV